MSHRPILVTVATLWHSYGPDRQESTQVEVSEVPLWDVVKTELFERYVEDLLWRPALWLDTHVNRHDRYTTTPWDIQLELRSYKLRHQNRRSRTLGRAPWTSTVKPTPYPVGRKRR